MSEFTASQSAAYARGIAKAKAAQADRRREIARSNRPTTQAEFVDLLNRQLAGVDATAEAVQGAVHAVVHAADRQALEDAVAALVNHQVYVEPCDYGGGWHLSVFLEVAA